MKKKWYSDLESGALRIQKSNEVYYIKRYEKIGRYRNVDYTEGGPFSSIEEAEMILDEIKNPKYKITSCNRSFLTMAIPIAIAIPNESDDFIFNYRGKDVKIHGDYIVEILN